jgi:hypothetical protein
MTELQPRRGLLSTIKGWMIVIAVIGVLLGAMLVAPVVFILAVVVLFETVAISQFRESRRRQPMSGCAEAIWLLMFLLVVPIVAVVAAVIALYAVCTVAPQAIQ